MPTQEILKNRNDFYDPTYEFDYPSHVPSKRAANSKGVCYHLPGQFSFQIKTVHKFRGIFYKNK